MDKYDYNSIKVRLIENIILITINRPAKLNSLNKEVKNELIDILNRIENSKDIKVIIITGAGNKSFIAGDDISEFENREKVDFELLQNLNSKIENFKRPIIAAINGYALGGGCELALACDFRIASETAKFGFPEINLGLIPGAGGTQRLPRLIGISKAKKMILTGKLIDAKDALNWGLIDKITKQDELIEECLKMAKILAEKPILALEFGKKALNYFIDTNIKNKLEKELDLVWTLKNTPESKKLVENFLNKKSNQDK